MPNYNIKVEVICPHCQRKREARGDVVRKAERDGKTLFCKPCRNQTRFESKPHPRKGRGIKNDPIRYAAHKSYMRARRRCRQGAQHHAAYKNVEFRFASFEEFFSEIGPRPDGCSIDRINPLGHYETGNVRWATILEQARNRLPKGYWSDISD